MKRFELRPEHVTLLRAATVQWNQMENGAPMIDPKRPYGNSDLSADLARVLGLSYVNEAGPSYEGARRAYLAHVETQTALEIVLRTGSFAVGIYETSSDYKTDWRLVARPK